MSGSDDGRRNPLVEVLERLGKELKTARLAARMTRPSVAKQVRVSVQTVYNWEHGRFAPSGRHFDRLCAVYSVPPRELLRNVYRGLAREGDLVLQDTEGLEPRAGRGQGQPEASSGEETGMLCPRCAFEGMRNDLSQPYLTEEGWVQECPVHGKLYLWGHWVIRLAAGQGEPPEVRCLICGGEMELLKFEGIPYWQCPGDLLHRISLPEWSHLVGGKLDKDDLRSAMEKRKELFMAQARAEASRANREASISHGKIP